MLVPLDAAAHTANLYEELKGHDELWRYLFDGPPADRAELEELVRGKVGKSDPYFLAILNKQTEKPIGIASYLRIEPKHRVIEVGQYTLQPGTATDAACHGSHVPDGAVCV